MTLDDINHIGRRRKRREEIRVPEIVAEILERMAGKMAEEFQNGDSDRIVEDVWKDVDGDYKDDHRGGGNGSSPNGSFNLIPSNSTLKGCTDLLVTFCFYDDSFQKRLLESLDHVSRHCGGTKDIYFITTKWNSAVFDKLKGYLETVRRRPVNIIFIYVGTDGFVVMPE